MNRLRLSLREWVLVALLALLGLGMLWYYGFRKPLDRELTAIRDQAAQADLQLAEQGRKLQSMEEMSLALEEILALPEEARTEIPLFDNQEAVLKQLDGILSATRDYTVQFQEPERRENGLIRRDLNVTFLCDSYGKAQTVIRALEDGRWRCLVGDLTVTPRDGDILLGSVSVSAAVTYLEWAE